jgi:hypothetical protein
MKTDCLRFVPQIYADHSLSVSEAAGVNLMASIEGAAREGVASDAPRLVARFNQIEG